MATPAVSLYYYPHDYPQIFERGDIGGRLKEMEIGGKSYDSGGSIIHSDNFYARALTEKVGKAPFEILHTCVYLTSPAFTLC